MTFQFVKDHPLRHTYPFGSNDIVLQFNDAIDLRERVHSAFDSNPDCRRIVVPVEPDNIAQISACEDAGLRYVLDVQLRSGEEYALMVAEPDWVTQQPTDTSHMELT